jgi:hypothetical protein
VSKTQLSSAVKVGGNTFTTNAKPDPYDFRDLEYRPVLQLLEPSVHADRRDAAFHVLTQKGESCTGHAVAATINTVLTRAAERSSTPTKVEPVSPYMLYRLARRYDDLSGEADIGSQLRAAFKGWLRHGVALDREWNKRAADQKAEPVDADIDLDEPDFLASCRQRPLGAYYRVNAYRLDDMQSAIGELHAIAVSGAIHDGWSKPRFVELGKERYAVIARAAEPEPCGGHAFALVGYNEIGFLVQNSWGLDWGDRGFAILTYEDWLLSAYDAWVARPGVPNTPFARPPSSSAQTATGGVVVHGGPNLLLLRNFVVNTTDNGRLSERGKMTSTPLQVADVFANMAAKHASWLSAGEATARHIVLYAHGGLVDENGGLTTAERLLPHWLDHRVYPINFAWESGALETILDAIADLLGVRLPFGAGFDIQEGVDTLVEGIARRIGSGLWSQMKGNAAGASDEGSGTTGDDIRGGTLIARRLADYVGTHGKENVKIHLAGHSAGSIFLTALVARLRLEGLEVDSLAFMGGAVRTDEFVRVVGPHLGTGVKRFTTFDLAERYEQDDTCDVGGKVFYHKSLLYLVARGLEASPDRATGVVPLVGLQVTLDRPIAGDGRSLRQVIDATGGRIVIAPGGDTQDLRSDAKGHGEFDNDQATLNAVLLRMLRKTSLPVLGPVAAKGPGGAAGAKSRRPNARAAGAGAGAAGAVGAGTLGAPPVAGAGPKRGQAAAPAEPGRAGLVGASMEGGPARAKPVRRPLKPSPTSRIPTEAAIAPKSGSPGFDMLIASGWKERERP